MVSHDSGFPFEEVEEKILSTATEVMFVCY
jgi:hypothetical protein